MLAAAATDSSHTDTLWCLLDNSADTAVVDNDGNSALHHATIAGNIDAALLLLNHSSNEQLNIANVNGWTALHFAAKTGMVEIVAQLIQVGLYIAIFF